MKKLIKPTKGTAVEKEEGEARVGEGTIQQEASRWNRKVAPALALRCSAEVLPVEDDYNVQTVNACKVVLHENEQKCKVGLKSDELDRYHVKAAGVRDLVEDASLHSENGTKDAGGLAAGTMDHKRSWRDVAIQGAMKKRSF